MSHFTVLVFAKENDRVNTLLAPYNENIEVEEYILEEVSNEEKDEMIKYYIREDKNNKTLSFEDLYLKYGESWNRNHWRNNENGILCNYSTYNPRSKWDWYEVGGRWNKSIPRNRCLAKNVPNNFIPFAFIDQKGEWHERAKMGWWATTSNEKESDTWDNEFRKALSEYNGYVTLIDCHI